MLSRPVTPETRYARAGDVHIAYQVVGDGPIDLVYVPPQLQQVEHLWAEPRIADRGEHALKGVPGVWRLWAAGAQGP